MNSKYLSAFVTGVLFLILIALVRFVDVAAIGPAGTSIGLSHLNGALHSLIGEHELWYNITKILGVAAFVPALLFALAGLIQMISRKSLLQVDREILGLGGLYVVMVVFYALFEIVVVNYRPVIEEGMDFPEASFPSSHTMLACIIMGSAFMLIERYVRSRAVAGLLRIICVVMMVVIVVGRLISGVHWFTDILGGVLISATLLFIYAGFIED